MKMLNLFVIKGNISVLIQVVFNIVKETSNILHPERNSKYLVEKFSLCSRPGLCRENCILFYEFMKKTLRIQLKVMETGMKNSIESGKFKVYHKFPIPKSF